MGNTSKLYLGSFDLMRIDKSKIKEFKRKDGTIGKSIDVTIWVDDSPDEDWKAVGIQQSTKKEEPKIYLGNAKLYVKPGEQGEPSPSTGAVADKTFNEDDDLPF